MVLGQRPRSWGTTGVGRFDFQVALPSEKKHSLPRHSSEGLAPWSPVRDSSPCCPSLTFKDSYGTRGHQACGFLRFWRAIFSLSHWRVAVLMRNRPSHHHIPHQTARSTHACTHTRRGKQIKTKRPWGLPLHVTGNEMAFTQRAEEEAGLAPPAAHRTFISVSHLHCHVKTYPQQPRICTSISLHSLLP